MIKNQFLRKGKVFLIFLFLSIFSFSVSSAQSIYEEPGVYGSAVETFLKDTGDTATGNYHFNDGWENNGLSIIDGDIYAQTGYFYNLTSLNVTEQNLTINDDLLVFGNSDLRQNLTVDTSTLFVDSVHDRVGIGTTSPDNALDVVSTSVQVRVGYDESVASTLHTRSGGSLEISSSSGGAIRLSPGGSEAMRLASDGQVGIGISSPSAGLDIDGTFSTHLNLKKTTAADFDFVRDDSTINSGNGLGRITWRGADPSGENAGARITAVADGTWATNDFPTNIQFQTDEAGTLTTRMIIKEDGKVGIGTTSPQQTLNVVGDLNVTGTTTLNGLNSSVTGTADYLCIYRANATLFVSDAGC